jgi:hypothetical protein
MTKTPDNINGNGHRDRGIGSTYSTIIIHYATDCQWPDKNRANNSAKSSTPLIEGSLFRPDKPRLNLQRFPSELNDIREIFGAMRKHVISFLGLP